MSLLTFSFYLLFSLSKPTLPPQCSVKELGYTSQASSKFNGVVRDGGGGGYINGQHLIVFSDTSTFDNKKLVGFTSNSVAYSNGKTPTKLTDFGDNGIPNLGVPWLANETAYAAKLHKQNENERLIIWPSSSIAPLHNGKAGVSVYVLVHLHPDSSGEVVYSTMVQYKPTSSGPHATRLAPTLFYGPNEVHFGSFSAATSPTTSSKDSYIYLFATVSTAHSIALARAPILTPSNRSTYSYWTDNSWSPHPLSDTDKNPNSRAHIVTDHLRFSSGDFLYSPYLQTWLLIYFVGQLDSTFYIRYSTSGRAEGPYSKPAVLYRTQAKRGGFNYAGHAYGGYDKGGRSVVLSWTWGGERTAMAEVTFK